MQVSSNTGAGYLNSIMEGGSQLSVAGKGLYVMCQPSQVLDAFWKSACRSK